MKLGTLINFSDLETLEKQFEDLINFGFDNCQLCSWSPEKWTDENAQGIKKLTEKFGVTISAFWCGWEGPAVWNFTDGYFTLGLVPVAYRQMRIKNLCDGADFAYKFGVEDIATHMGYIPENPNDPEFGAFCVAVKTVAQHLKKNNQYLLFETGQETPVTMLRCFQKVGLDNLGVNLDTGNLILYGKGNPVDALDVIGKYVRNIHAKDGNYPVNGNDLGWEVKVGTGKVDFRALITKLHELNYDSYITIEREISGPQQNEDIKETKIYLENLINEICKN